MSDEAVYVATSGAIVQQMRLEVLSNNLANINTVGFKEDKPVFSNYLPGELNNDISTNPDNVLQGEAETLFPYLESDTQVKFDGSITNFAQGQLRQTGNRLDFALEGKGFFCVKTAQGIEQYTRKGNFELDDQGRLVTQDGASVLGRNGREIRITDQNITVDEEGNISAAGENVDTLKIVDFTDLKGLNKVGDCLFIPSDSTATVVEPAGVRVRQGCIELSNVNPIKVMTEIIEVHRAFEAYQKILRSLDETVSQSINEVGET